MRQLRFSLSARRDLQAIAAYVSEAAGPGVALQITARMQAKLMLMAETPGEIGAPRPEIRPGIRSLLLSPYLIFFRYRGTAEIQVVRILHERQDVDGYEIG